MHDTEPCNDCKHQTRCNPHWGKDCKMNGGTKIPRMSATGTINTLQSWERAEREEQARQQAVRDQLRVAEEGKPKGFKPYWMERAI